jgi:hypothetical protein
MVRVWDSRIELVRNRIKALRKKGFNLNDEDVKALYERLRYFQECRRCALKEMAWEDV